MSIWKKKEFTVEVLNKWASNIVKHLGIEFTAIDDNSLSAKMPVDERTQQPFGILHGGASVVLAETLGSMAGYMCLEDPTKITVGLEVNANHIRPVVSGFVHGTTTPIHLGRTTQIWQTEIVNDEGKKVCVSRLTLSVVDMPNKG